MFRGAVRILSDCEHRPGRLVRKVYETHAKLSEECMLLGFAPVDGAPADAVAVANGARSLRGMRAEPGGARCPRSCSVQRREARRSGC
ncbi:protein of unknown function (plasmid) [Caballeronia sp. S22]